MYKLLLILSLIGTNVCSADPDVRACQSSSESSQRRAVEMTFLKSTPGNRERLKDYIVQNWFAVDRIAKSQGLMREYTVLDTASDEGPWNVLVSVTYIDARGYDGIKEAFEKIRSAHKVVLIEGKSLRELGALVASKRLYEDIVEAPE